MRRINRRYSHRINSNSFRVIVRATLPNRVPGLNPLHNVVTFILQSSYMQYNIHTRRRHSPTPVRACVYPLSKPSHRCLRHRRRCRLALGASRIDVTHNTPADYHPPAHQVVVCEIACDRTHTLLLALSVGARARARCARCTKTEPTSLSVGSQTPVRRDVPGLRAAFRSLCVFCCRCSNREPRTCVCVGREHRVHFRSVDVCG